MSFALAIELEIVNDFSRIACHHGVAISQYFYVIIDSTCEP